MSEPLADIIARLQERTRPHAASPVTARRLPSDSPAAAPGDRGSVLTGTRAETQATRKGRRNTMANARNGGGSMHYRPRADYYAGAIPGPTAPRVHPVTGRKIAGPATVIRKGRRVPSGFLLEARADSVDAGYRGWVGARSNLARDAGDVLPAGESYPHTLSARGNLGCSPLY